MSKAEDAYLDYFLDGRLRNCSRHDAFVYGYHQAEKDLKLAWEDIERIDDISIRLDGTEEAKEMSNKEFYQEILKRFKAQKGEEV